MVLVAYDTITKTKIRIMKKQSFITFRKGVYSTFLTVTFLLTTVAYSHAADGEDTLKKAEIKYVGQSDKYLAFDVKYKNSDQKKFVVQLVDKESNQVLYQKEYRDSALDKKIYLLVENENCTVSFRIRKGRELHEQSFNINNEIMMVDNLSVTKL
jgi:hypothetical protein